MRIEQPRVQRERRVRGEGDGIKSAREGGRAVSLRSCLSGNGASGWLVIQASYAIQHEIES